jgi:hypothetical protein
MLISKEALVHKELSKDLYVLIEAVQMHMFPEESRLPGAKAFRATDFLQSTIFHPSYDRDLRKFVIEGAEKLQEREKGRFLDYNDKEKEQALRAFEETSYGDGWLDRIMLLSLEGLLSDPVYGGNFRESGWKALQTRGGEPRPTTRYIAL